MTSAFAQSSDGTRIAYTTAGDPSAPAILFIHGWSQWGGCWSPIVDRLSDQFHLITMDLRGHGGSDIPEDEAAYTQTALWGDDVQAVLRASGAGPAALVGWSYGSRVVAAYLATHGDTALSGVVLTGAILAIGAAREPWMMGERSPGSIPDLFNTDLVPRLAATLRFVEGCTASPLPRDIFATAVGANMLCPVHVRRALFKATVDFRPTYSALTVPALVIHGTEDHVVTPATGEAIAACIPRGRYLPYTGAGHTPFLEAADSFAQDIAHFVTDCAQEATHD